MVAEREIQAVADTDMKGTQTGVLREEEELRRMADENRKLGLASRRKRDKRTENARDIRQAGREDAAS